MPLPTLNEEASDFVDRLLVPCTELNWSKRAENRLYEASIETLAHLVARTEEEIHSLRNLGKKTLNEIKEMLAELRFSLGMDLRKYQAHINAELEKKDMPLLEDWNEEKKMYERKRRPSHPPKPQEEQAAMNDEQTLSTLLESAKHQLEQRLRQIVDEISAFSKLLDALRLGIGVNVQEGTTHSAICFFFQKHGMNPTVQQIHDHVDALGKKKAALKSALYLRGLYPLDLVITALRAHEQYDRPL
ncbi:TPA: hypothetical protein DEP34_01925 [Candidatus Uhrbacteria bacterium]|uniref:DNA-directed RNA polymerase subunit alpha n=2 Tax=Candidatus Uhriibacteriota TaxID=1752732 RepID=A0A0G1SHZ0_9BACT|nr:MAG: DNA-directed RNA polymerase subunit alpha [Candidatus Uhrbacteria bacterium GW2011_GWF2_46_218]KKU41683.1 MAG: DNA-directed RNA polymerase subunit alpha [Candidatus Uhrbacteria bacterium GW2011_GWE2_46_68]HBK33448.1 hypothetical protein [Candidatus Uhrbacteria bacterium]HCB19125.1 hypothetical protein [Candidatus Uhrbacteria bacterium]